MAIDRKRSYYLLYIERVLDLLVNIVQKELRGGDWKCSHDVRECDL
jgi:hypothetical protein